MPDQTWQDIAREWVEPWEGAKDVHGLFVCVVGADGYTERLGEAGDRYGRADCCVDLTHPPTAREAVARLALFLGAPVEAVEEGVRFYMRGGVWWIDAGCDTLADGEAFWGSEHFDIDAGSKDRPSAIATAWREARQAKERQQ